MKVCFIGNCGHSAVAYHFFRKRPDAEICGMAPESPEEALERSFSPEIPLYSDYIKMLDECRPQLAVVSPVFGHTGSVILECARRGIDVFSEKPVAASQEELERVAEAIKRSGIRFCAMHFLRFDPAFYHGAQLVKSGAIGQVRMVTAQKSYKFGTRPAWYHRRELYGGTIPWVGIHAIDWVYHFTGKRFLSVSARQFGRDPEMAALCRFEMEDEILCSVNLDFFRPMGAETHGYDRIRCVGTRGVLEVRDGRIYLSDEKTDRVITPTEAPDLLGEFVDGGTPIPADEIFYLTGVALAARDAADQNKTVAIRKVL